MFQNSRLGWVGEGMQCLGENHEENLTIHGTIQAFNASSLELFKCERSFDMILSIPQPCRQKQLRSTSL